MPTFKITVSIGLASPCSRTLTMKIPDEDLEGMSADERKEYIDDAAEDRAQSTLSWDVVEVKP